MKSADDFKYNKKYLIYFKYYCNKLIRGKDFLSWKRVIYHLNSYTNVRKTTIEWKLTLHPPTIVIIIYIIKKNNFIIYNIAEHDKHSVLIRNQFLYWKSELINCRFNFIPEIFQSTSCKNVTKASLSFFQSTRASSVRKQHFEWNSRLFHVTAHIQQHIRHKNADYLLKRRQSNGKSLIFSKAIYKSFTQRFKRKDSK